MAVQSDAFEVGMDFIRAVEGGFSDRPPSEDPGGLTNFGITQKTLSAYRIANKQDVDMPGSVRDLTNERAERIYRKMYWNVCRCDELPVPIALVVFNAAVQSGPSQAARWLQHAVGTKADGIIGTKTIAAANSANSSTAITEMLSNQIIMETMLYNWSPNRLGWTRRLFRLCWLASQYSRYAEVRS